MTKILNMANYTEVRIRRKIMTMALNITDLDNPNYMPTTRDLSIAKRNMILEWLKNPKFNEQDTPPAVEDPVCPRTAPTNMYTSRAGTFTPPETRCDQNVAFADPPELTDDVLRGILNGSALPYAPRMYMKTAKCLPLLECTAERVKEKLQEAVQLEWATIPVYLTSLYSIVEDCNFEIYELIQGIVIQEMLHMTQAANTLIAMGGRPLIDSADVTPTFPGRLPGCVLPGLNVTLEKLSLKHIHNVFMSIEVPKSRTNTTERTIGTFYEEIQDCIRNLTDEDFQKSSPSKQVNWPYKKSGIVKVTNVSTADAGLTMIISQGEGADLLDPRDISNRSYAHFYKFEEIVCGNRIEKSKVNESEYAYSGAPIPFEENGVWNMRENPKSGSICYPSNCYTQARAFHKVYRILLRKMQEMFDNAKDSDVAVAVQLMESLQAHAKTLMWTKHVPDDPDNVYTCGPVWEYDWEEGNYCNGTSRKP